MSTYSAVLRGGGGLTVGLGTLLHNHADTCLYRFIATASSHVIYKLANVTYVSVLDCISS